jgi:L-ascorbate metabolism protein UlaG (beta-lactamase superfamily)
MKKLILLILILILLTLGTTMIFRQAEFGRSPNEKYYEMIKESSQLNMEKKIFQNRRPKILESMNKRMFDLKLIKDWFSKGPEKEPLEKLPEHKPNLIEFKNSKNGVKVIWLGHSSLLINIEGKIVLIDPVFSKAASPIKMFVQRFQPAVIKLEELPSIDYIIISHDHYDHLDYQSIKFFKDKKNKFLVPLGVDSHLLSWGISQDRIIAKDWWQSFSEEKLIFTATPAQHFSGRAMMDRNKTLWASWVIQSDNYKLYFSGDSGYDIHFKQIGDKFGPFDLAFIESGQYNKKWEEVHLLPEQSIQAFKDLNAKRYMPIHWGMFVLSLHAWNEPPIKLNEFKSRENYELVIPQIGQLVDLEKKFDFINWWEELKSN